jgi:hypothetical protein
MSSMTFLVPAVLIAVCMLALGGLLLRRRKHGPMQADSQWLQNFSTEAYAPMARLLSEEDFRFLSQQPGYEPVIAERLRAARRGLFRRYLRLLARDFQRLYGVAQTALVCSAQDNPELAGKLFRLKLDFWLWYSVAHCRLAGHALGLSTVDVSVLVRTLDTLQASLQLQLAPQAAS